MRVLRFAVTGFAFWWVFRAQNLSEISAALGRASPWAFLGACALSFLNLAVGTTRWRALIAAYGAPNVPDFLTLFRLYVVGYFYNMWLPGGVGGDVVRGLATRAAFGESGATAGVAIVLVERVLGLVGLFVVVGAVSVIFPFADSESVLLWSALALLAGIGAIVGLAVGRMLAPYLPGPLGTLAGRLPQIVRPGWFALAASLSLATQSLVALTGHTVVSSLDPSMSVATSFVAVPLASATAFIPITVGGAGAREYAFQRLYVHAGMSMADATVASILVSLAYYLVALTGAFVPLPRRVGESESTLPERQDQMPSSER